MNFSNDYSHRNDGTGVAITFGMCLPAACSLNLIENNFNDLLHEKENNMSIIIPSETCVFEEYASEFKSTDKIMM